MNLKVPTRIVAVVLGISESRVRALVAEGVLECQKGGPRGNQSMFDLPETVASYLDYRLEGLISTPELAQLQQQRTRKLAADAARAEFNLEVLKGKYLNSEAVGVATTQQALTIKSRICGLGARLYQQLAPVTDPDTILELLDEEAESICSILVSDFTALEAEAAKLIAEHQGENEQAA